jgi:hypothetical protein
MDHLVYCDVKAKVLDKMLAKQKTMIARGAAGRKLPYGRVNAGDVLYFCENDGTGIIKAKAKVKSVINSDRLTLEEGNALIEKYNKELNLSKDQLKRWGGKKYYCLIEVKDVVIIEPLKYDRQNNMDDWITVENIKSILVGSKEAYKSIRLSCGEQNED